LLVRFAPGGAVAASLNLGLVTGFGPIAAPNGVYFLSVRAGNAAGFGPESNVVQVNVPSLPPPPGNPTGLTATVVGNSATFNWTAPGSGGPVANYVLLASNAPFPAPAIASLVLPPTPTAALINGIPPGVWYIRIFARNAAGNSALSTNEVQITVAGPAPPAAPTMNAPTVSAGNTVNLSWSAAAGATSYTLIARLTPAGAPFLVAPMGANTSVGFPGVPSGTYYLQVVANNAFGSSPPSNQVTLVVP
jgi:cellulose 1,4-beta-cellobiosidase